VSRIFCIVGKSASGKDTIYKEILSSCPKLIQVIPYTTRPKRIDEKNGVDYNFVTVEQLNDLESEGKVIEKRTYFTTQGAWYYFTLKFETEDDKDYILITTLEGARGIVRQYGSESVHIVYLTVDDKTRLLRCIERESKQINPDYEEVCRRFIADQKDFAHDKIGTFKNIHYIDTSFDINECIKKWFEIYGKTVH
jgi:guanylate kinase